MACQNINIMFAKLFEECKSLYVVCSQISSVAFFQCSICTCIRTLERVQIVVQVIYIVSYSAREIQFQPVSEADVSRDIRIKLIHSLLPLVILVGRNRVTCSHVWTCHTIAIWCTIVVSLMSIFICQDIWITI